MFFITKQILTDNVFRTDEVSLLRINGLPEHIKYSTQIVGLLHTLHKYLKNKTDEEIVILDEFIKDAIIFFVKMKNNQGNIDYSYLEYYEILEVIILDNLLIKIVPKYKKTIPNFENYELFAILSLSYLLTSYDKNHSKEIDYQDIFPSFETIRMADKNYFLFLLKEQNIENLTVIDKLTSKKIKSINAQKAGRCKKSPYEKAGTIHAVNELLNEKQDLLQQRGGKSQLCRMILDLISENQIPAPNTPTQKTVETWIDNYRKQKSTS